MSDEVLWLNGACLRAADARLPVRDHAVQFGVGLFETFRTWDGRAPLLARNLARLRAGCRAYRIEPSSEALLPQAELNLPRILRELLDRNGCADAVFRYTVTAGAAPPGLPSSTYRQPSEMVALRPLPVLPAAGWNLHLLATRRLTPEFAPRPKSLQYGNALMGRWEMFDRGLLGAGAEGLMLTPDGCLAEGVTTNVFLLHEGRLCTPSLELGVLPGVVRSVVLELAKAADLPALEGAFPADWLAKAEMVFLTSGAVGLAPVRAVSDASGQVIAEPATAAHPWFKRLAEGFRAMCRA